MSERVKLLRSGLFRVKDHCQGLLDMRLEGQGHSSWATNALTAICPVLPNCMVVWSIRDNSNPYGQSGTILKKDYLEYLAKYKLYDSQLMHDDKGPIELVNEGGPVTQGPNLPIEK